MVSSNGGGTDASWWERHGPRLPSHGIKAHTRRGPFARNWWAGRWIAALERVVSASRLSRGRTYARVGQVVSLDVEREGVKAVVQGSRAEPYKISIKLRKLSDADWARVIDAMAAEALYAARLLSGEMPEQIEDVFASVGSSLLPTEEERFDDDPFLMFLLRGRSQDEIVAALRALRASSESPPSDEADAESEPELDIGTFWTAPAQPDEIALHFALPETHALAIKRLGPPPFVPDHPAFAAAMERMYEQISEYALLLALGDA